MRRRPKTSFCRKVLEKWLGPADNWEEQFDSIDMTNKKGEDAVLFVVIYFNCRPSRSLTGNNLLKLKNELLHAGVLCVG